MANYRNRLASTKQSYPFSKWEEWGIEQHNDKAINLFVSVFNQLLEELQAFGEQGRESDKLVAIRKAVETLNILNARNEILIETDEREDLCELFKVIEIIAGIDRSKYGEGEGPENEWRDW